MTKTNETNARNPSMPLPHFLLHYTFLLAFVNQFPVDVMTFPRFSCVYYAYAGTIEMIH